MIFLIFKRNTNRYPVSCYPQKINLKRNAIIRLIKRCYLNHLLLSLSNGMKEIIKKTKSHLLISKSISLLVIIMILWYHLIYLANRFLPCTIKIYQKSSLFQNFHLKNNRFHLNFTKSIAYYKNFFFFFQSFNSVL